MGFGGSGGSGGSIASSSDVALSSPADGQVLAYDAAAAKWENQTAPSGTDLTTVGIGTGANQIDGFWQGTQAEYDAITTKDSATFYLITGA